MFNVLESLMFGFEEIVKYYIIRRVLLVGSIISGIWILLGWFLWDKIISTSSAFIDLLPFSMLRFNGATIISTFFWFCVVLITFALLITFFGNLLLEKYSKERYSAITLLLALGSAVFWGVVWFFYEDSFHGIFVNLLNWLPFETVEKGISYLLGLYFIYNGIIVSLVLVTSFFSESTLSLVQKNNFPYDNLLDEDKVKLTKKRVFDICLYFIISVAVFPLLFIPVVNFIVQLGLWIWLLKDILVFDTVSLWIDAKHQNGIAKHKVALYVIATMSALFNFIPVLNLFGPVFGEMAMFYYFKELREEVYLQE